MPATKTKLDWTPIAINTSDPAIASAWEKLNAAKVEFQGAVSDVLTSLGMVPAGHVVKVATQRDQPAYAFAAETGASKPAVALTAPAPTLVKAADKPTPAKKAAGIKAA